MFTLMRALAYTALFLGIVLVYLPGQVLRWAGITRPADLGAPQFLAMALVTLGVALAVWCVVAFAVVGRGTAAPFDPPRRLVVVGPYRFVRNPMYMSAGLALSGIALFFASLELVGYVLLCFAAVDSLVRWYEEPTLRRSFGPEYEAYCRRVRRWWPARPRPAPPGG